MKKPVNLGAIAFAKVNKLAKEVEEIKNQLAKASQQIREQSIQSVEKTESSI